MFSKIVRGILTVVLLGLSLAACAGPEPTPPPGAPAPVEPTPGAVSPGETAPSEPVAEKPQGGELMAVGVERDMAPTVANSDLEELAGGNTAFAFDMYRAVREGQEGNLVFSPFSISLALAMTYAGARGETEQQMADVLHYALAQERLHPAFNALDLDLMGRGEALTEDEASEGQRFTLNIANAIWGQAGFPFLPDFLETLALNYGAGLQLADFASQPEEARLAINDWVAEHTEDRIKDIVPPGAIDALTRLVLANAIYFNASWQTPFEESATHDDPFTLLDGSQVTVPMMTQQESFAYVQGDGYQAVEIPYYGGDTSMIVLLPDAGRFEAFESDLDAATFGEIVNSLAWGQVSLTMPRFEYETNINLNETLIGMGMPDAFDGGRADFSGMVNPADGVLFISDVLHKAFIKVDESGTEAAAATVVIMKLAAAPEPGDIIEIKIDRPFIFAIYDRPSGSVLFLGRVLNPAG